MWYRLLSLRPTAVARRGLISLLAGLLLAGCAEDQAGPVAPVVASVVLQAGQGALFVGDERPYTARALDGSGREITGRMVNWISTVPGVATISTGGVVTAVAAGTTEIRASIDGVLGTSALTVTEAPVASVELDAADVLMLPGETRQLLAVAKDAAGRQLTGRVATWTSLSPGVVTVATDGWVTAVAAGLAQVTVTIEGIAAVARVNVGRKPVAAIAVWPAGPVLGVGESVQFEAILRDADGQVLDGRIVEWSVANAHAQISNAGRLTAVSEGQVTVTARSEGISASMAVTIVDDEAYEYDLLYHRFTVGGDSELFVLTLGAGQAPTRLNAGTVSRYPTASPDGRRVAFAVSMKELGTGVPVDDIFVIDRVDGRNLRRLTSVAGIDDQPTWSPAGGRIAYRHAELNGRSDIWVMNEDGSAPINLTGEMDSTAVRSAPAWARDGSRLAFAQTHNGAGSTVASLWVMNADGSGKRQITSTMTGFDASPTWSPDGSRIAFVRYYGEDADITIVRLSDGALTRLVVEGRQSMPAWSPDGALIAFGQSLRGIDELYTMRTDGTQVRLRTTDRYWGGGLVPSWIRRF